MYASVSCSCFSLPMHSPCVYPQHRHFGNTFKKLTAVPRKGSPSSQRWGGGSKERCCRQRAAEMRAAACSVGGTALREVLRQGTGRAVRASVGEARLLVVIHGRVAMACVGKSENTLCSSCQQRPRLLGTFCTRWEVGSTRCACKCRCAASRPCCQQDQGYHLAPCRCLCTMHSF